LICGKGSMFSPGRERGAVPNAGEVDVRESGGAGLPADDGNDKELSGSYAGDVELSPAHRQLINHMKQVPLLHYEVMAFYHRFLLDRPGIAGDEKLDSSDVSEPGNF
jgi:hypothetical protein